MIFIGFDKPACKTGAQCAQLAASFSNAIREADPLSHQNLSQIEKPKTEKDKDVPLDDNPGRRNNPNFPIHPDFSRTPWTYFQNYFDGIPSGVLD